MAKQDGKEMKDLRVPTFIPLDADNVFTKKTTKRKRPIKNDNKPNKKKAIKNADKITNGKVKDTLDTEDSSISHIWIGANIKDENGTFSVYFGDNDERNCTDIFTKSNDIQDIDYAYVLGTLKAVEIIQSLNEPFIVNVSCRDLPAAITEKTLRFQHNEIVEKIRELLEKREQKVQVRYISGRNAPEQQKKAMSLASEALEKLTQNDEMNVDKEEAIVEEENKVEEIEITVTSTEDVRDKLTEIVANTDEVDKIQQKVEDALVSNSDNDNVVVETKVETTIQVKVIETEQENQTTDESPQQEQPSSWFGLKSIFDVLSSPFRARKSS